MKTAQVWTLMDKKRKVIIHPIKLSLFQQCKLLECVEESTNTHYLLFFYKNDFLTATKKETHEPESFLAQVEANGIHIDAPSPLFSLLVRPTLSLQIIPFNQLLNQLKRNYQSEEVALIFSYFDSYIPIEELDKIIKELFFSYRRNGQLLAAYRLATVLLARGYQTEWVLSTTKQLDYANAAKRYTVAPSTLLSTEPIFAEQKFFSDYKKTENHEFLLTLYSQQNNPINILILSMGKWMSQPTKATYQDFIQTLNVHLHEKDILSYLTELLDDTPISSGLHQDVYGRLIKVEEYEKATLLLLSYSFPLLPEQQEQLPTVFEHLSFSGIAAPIEDIATRMFALLEEQPILLERLIRLALPALLQKHELLGTQTLLNDASQKSETPIQLPIMQKLNVMVDLFNEPDKQMKLGEYYYELEQFEKAIECFSWEMELQPNEHEPLQWLAKSYNKLGKTAEAKTYQQLISQLQRSS